MGKLQPEWYGAERILAIAEQWASGKSVSQISDAHGWPIWRVVQALRMFWHAYDDPHFDLFPEHARKEETTKDWSYRCGFPNQLPIAERRRIALEIIARERDPERRPLLWKLFPWMAKDKAA